MPGKSRRPYHSPKPGFKRRMKGNRQPSSSNPQSQTLESVMQPATAQALPAEEQQQVEQSTNTIRRELGLIERITKARVEAGVEPGPLETLIVGEDGQRGIREILTDFAKQNPDMFDSTTQEGAAAVELYEAAIRISEVAMKADPRTAKKLYERLKFILKVVREQEGSQSAVAKKLEQVIQPVAKQLKEKTTFKSFAKEGIKDYFRRIPEKIAADIPIVGGILSDYLQTKRESREDLEDFSGELLRDISRKGRRTDDLDLGTVSERRRRTLPQTDSEGKLREQGAVTAAELFANAAPSGGIAAMDPEKNPLGAIYNEVVAIRELMEGERKPKKDDKDKKQKSALDRLKELYNKIFGKPQEGTASGEGGGQGGNAVQNAIENRLMSRAATTVGGLFTGLATPTMSVGAAGAGAIGAYGLAGAGIGTAAAYGINRGIDYLTGAKEGEGLADYQMQANTYNPLEFLNLGNYSTSANADPNISKQQAKGMKPVATQSIESGISTAFDIARSVKSGVMTQSEAESAIKSAQSATPPKYDSNFLPFYKDVQSALDDADGDMAEFNKLYPPLMQKYGYDSDQKDQRLSYRVPTAETAGEQLTPNTEPKITGSVAPTSGNDTLGKVMSQVEMDRQALANSQSGSPQSAPTTNNNMVNNNSSVINNNFSEEAKVRNNEPTMRQMQRNTGWLGRV